jgi:hypothetical protein
MLSQNDSIKIDFKEFTLDIDERSGLLGLMNNNCVIVNNPFVFTQTCPAGSIGAVQSGVRPDSSPGHLSPSCHATPLSRRRVGWGA